MKKYTKVFLFSIIIFISFCIFPIIFAKGQGIIEYSFEKDNIYERDFIEQPLYSAPNPKMFFQEFNVRQSQFITNDYITTYSFENDITDSYSNGEELDIIENIKYCEEADIGNNDGFVAILDDYDGHNKVLRLRNIGGSKVYITNVFTPKTIRTVELWFKGSSGRFYISDTNGAIMRFASSLTNNRIRFSHGDGLGGVGTTDYNDWNGNWVHIRFHFNTITDVNSVWINGVSLYTEKNFTNDIDSDGILSTGCILESSNIDGYYDAISYSWFDSVGINLVPNTEFENGIFEPDKYTFTLKDYNTFYDSGDDNVDGWTDLENPAGDFVNSDISKHGIQDNIRRIIETNCTTTLTSNEPIGITKELIANPVYFDIINVSIDLEFKDLGNENDTFKIKLYSDDGTLEVYLRIDTQTGNESKLYYWDNVQWWPIYDNITINEILEFNIYMNYNDNLVIIDFYKGNYTDIDGNPDIFKRNYYNDIFYFSLLDDSKEGLRNITLITEFLSFAKDVFDSTMAIHIWQIGVYYTGLVFYTGIAYVSEALLEPYDWDFIENNLFTIQAVGNMIISVCSGTEGIGIGYQPNITLYIINQNNTYQNYVNLTNLYGHDDGGRIIAPIVVFYVRDKFNISYMNIEGATIVRGSDIDYLEFSYSSVDIHKNYFYVDDSNNLRYILDIDDTNLEYIQADFNITNTPTTDYFLSYKGSLNGNAFGDFRIVYGNTTLSLPIPTIQKTTNAFLDQNEIINGFGVLITDNDNDAKTGFQTIGFITNIRLRYSTDIEVSIITFNIMIMIVPLIMIIVPTLAISSNYGKNLVVPLFVLMSIICVVATIIPIWLFFIIMISIITFMFLRKQDNGI